MPYRSAPTRALPDKPSLAQLREQAKELLDSYLVGNEAAVAEVKGFHWNPNPSDFALADAERVRILLIKLVHTFDATLPRSCGPCPSAPTDEAETAVSVI